MSESLTPEQVNELPLASCPLPHFLVPYEVSLEEICLKLERETIIGFDTETKPAFKAGQSYSPALMQLASKQAVYLVQLPVIQRLQPLQKLLEMSSLKVGVGIGEDLRRLMAYFNLRASPNKGSQFVDLTTLARSQGLATGSLRGLTAELLRRRLSKGAQLTNWGAPILTPQQLRYAALDAWASREIYLRLKDKNK